jgi:hypothetical protein
LAMMPPDGTKNSMVQATVGPFVPKVDGSREY